MMAQVIEFLSLMREQAEVCDSRHFGLLWFLDAASMWEKNELALSPLQKKIKNGYERNDYLDSAFPCSGQMQNKNV